jgi:hypothetical protein
VELARPKGGKVVVKANAGVDRLLINAMVGTTEWQSLDYDEDEE